MAENKLLGTVETLFKGMDSFISTKTVVGEPIEAGGAVIIPLVDVSCGMGAGAFANNSKEAGGMSAKMSPVAILIIQDGITKLVNVKNQDILAKIIDMIPELINKFAAKNKISDEVENLANEMSENSEAKFENIPD